MEQIICSECGKKLKKIAVLTDDECKRILYINSINDTLDYCLTKFDNIKLDKKLKICIRRIFAKKAEAFISERIFYQDIVEKYNVSNYKIIDGVLYIHEN